MYQKLLAVLVLILAVACASAGPTTFGLRATAIEHRIVGGEEAHPNEFPFIIDLTLRDGRHYCGGSLIAPSWVLTASHCVTSPASVYIAVAGEHDQEIFEGPEQRREVEAIFLHPAYNPFNFSSDIALMKLKVPVVLNSNVKLVQLAPAGLDPTANGSEANATVAGWGALTEGGSSPTTLYNVTVPLVNNTRCKELYETGSQYSVDETMICAGVKGKDSCQGDSGGPMICDGPNGDIVLCGIVSWGIGCARDGFPGVYARVSHFLNWIEDTIAANAN